MMPVMWDWLEEQWRVMQEGEKEAEEELKNEDREHREVKRGKKKLN